MTHSPWSGKRLGVVGGGNMAEAIVQGVLRAGLLPPAAITVHDPLPERRAVFAALGCAATDDPAEVPVAADVVLLATKPQQLDAALAGLPLERRHLLVSILAGVGTERLERLLPDGARVVRAMPNTPLLVGRGATALAGGCRATREDVDLALALFAASGDAAATAEADLDAVTALSGSGPAYVFYFAEALLAGAAAMGLEPGLARRLTAATLAGAAAMLEAGGDETELRRRVTSPGGTTAAAIRVLEEKGFKETVVAALAAARDRSVELGRGDG